MSSARKVTLITGCSSGIGLATAVAFAQRGDAVVATMRHTADADSLRAALDGARVTADMRALDVADDDSVAGGIAAIISDYGQIDVVVSNAGIGCDGTTEQSTIADFRALFETNTLGAVRLLHAVLPGWRDRRAGRFISVGSLAGVVGQPFHDAYCASKFAVEGLLESMHPVVAQFGITVSIVEPGPVVSSFAGKLAAPNARIDPGVYAASRQRFHEQQAISDAGAQSSADIAEMIVRVAGERRPVLRYQTSEMVQRLVGLKLNDMTGERITTLTSRWV